MNSFYIGKFKIQIKSYLILFEWEISQYLQQGDVIHLL
jgi:hypothetical protein